MTSSDRPNIVLVHWHDLGTHLGTYGVPGVPSLAVDQLAAEGVRFDQAFCATPLCSPARSALMTGRYPHSNGIIGLQHRGWEYADGVETLPMHLRRLGYHSANFGMQHESANPERLGYDEVHDARDPETGWQRADTVVDEAAAWLRAPERRQEPFLAVVGFFEVHRPYPEELYPPDDPDQVAVPAFLPDNAHTRADLAAFQGSIRVADRATGRLIQTLRDEGLLERTWIVFTTDHGMAFPGGKSTLYDPGIRISLIMRPPDDGAAYRREATDRLAAHVDVLPTLLELGGGKVPDEIQGISHAAWLRGGDEPGRAEVFAEKTYHDAYDPMRAVRTGRWKYIRNAEPGPRLVLPQDIEASPTRAGMGDDHLAPRPDVELYDLSEDPWERRNLAGTPGLASVEGELATTLERWQQETGDPLLAGPIPPPDSRD
ncbi:sulfatase [Actinopolymorpha alba]|uniref:sulfatase family protein n=1 Tax=Actinopolymorpha alba TaxID=533267 RepID=UPI0003758A63|nr:sulfatase [Actinopolymorpha alba]